MTLIKKWITLHPSDLGKNIKENIKKQLNKELVLKCDEKIGYFIEIKEVCRILDNRVTNSTSDIMCFVEFEAEIFKPIVDMVIDEAEILKIYENGILLNAMNIQKILIPSHTLTSEYIIENNTLKKGEQKIEEHDKIKVKIKAIKYDNKKFNCIGLLV